MFPKPIFSPHSTLPCDSNPLLMLSPQLGTGDWGLLSSREVSNTSDQLTFPESPEYQLFLHLLPHLLPRAVSQLSYIIEEKNQHPERLRNLAKATQPGSGRAGARIQVCLFQGLRQREYQ